MVESRKASIIFFSVLFNPNANAIKNIVLARAYGFKSIVFINKVDSELLNEISNLEVIFLGDNSNVGLGVAFYELEKYLAEIGGEYYIYFDQDTVTTEDTWGLISRTYLDFFSEENTGMVFYGRSKVEASDLVVSSGCLFSMEIINKIGRHDKSYFVEGVDYEFCLRLKINDLFIRNVFTESIDHFILQDGAFLRFLGFNIRVRVYGKSRTRDLNVSHAKLICTSLLKGEYLMFLKFLKSAILFNLSEYFSRFVMKFL